MTAKKKPATDQTKPMTGKGPWFCPSCNIRSMKGGFCENTKENKDEPEKSLKRKEKCRTLKQFVGKARNAVPTS